MSETKLLFVDQNESSAAPTMLVGAIGEKLAADFLVRNGFRLVMANFKIPIGRNRRDAIVTGEIDLIAFEADVLCFVEVKTRSSDEFVSPLAAVNRRKQRQITRAARMYRKIFQLGKIKFRYDAISIVLNESEKPKIELVRNFWTEDVFRKKVWSDEYF